MKLTSIKPKIVITTFIVAIVILALIAVIPAVMAALMGPGIKTEPLDASKASAASTDINGEWAINAGSSPNFTSAGFTFEEVLPGDRRTTSGTTTDVEGRFNVEGERLQSGTVTVDLTDIRSDNDVRDQNVRDKILETTKYPKATFVVTEEIDLSAVPEDGSVSTIEVTGDLTIKDVTKSVTEDFKVLRDGDRLVVSGDIRILREDFDVSSPDFIAAKIAEEGDINVLLSMKKMD